MATEQSRAAAAPEGVLRPPVPRPGQRRRDREKRRAVKGDTLALASIAVFLLLWQLSGLFLNPLLLSTPLRVIRDFIAILANGVLIKAFLSSGWEMLFGFAIAAVLGIGGGILMGFNVDVEMALDPYVNLANATPTIALLPVMEIWFGLGLWARIGFIVVISIWPMLINTLVGIKNVQRGYRDVGTAFGLGGIAMGRRIMIPAAMPFIITGMRISLAHAAVGMILSGQEVGESGLGGLTENYGSFYQTGHLVAAIISATALAMLAFTMLRAFQNRFYPWIAGTSAAQR